MDVQEGQLRAGMSPTQPGFRAELPSSYGVLDSQALELDPALQAPAPAGPMESLPELPEGTPTAASSAAAIAVEARDAALEAATTAALAGKMEPAHAPHREHCPTATVSSIAAAVLARIDAGGSSTGGGGSEGTHVTVVTQQGCWHRFYEEVAMILLGSNGQPSLHASGRTHSSGALDSMSEAAGALTAAGSGRDGSFSGSDAGRRGGGINGQLAVAPEAAAEVIVVIEMAMQSSKEGCTLMY